MKTRSLNVISTVLLMAGILSLLLGMYSIHSIRGFPLVSVVLLLGASIISYIVMRRR